MNIIAETEKVELAKLDAVDDDLGDIKLDSDESWNSNVEVSKPASLGPEQEVTQIPGESPLCWLCRILMQRYNEPSSHGLILETKDNFFGRVDQGCHLCLLFSDSMNEGRGSRRDLGEEQDLVTSYSKWYEPRQNIRTISIDIYPDDGGNRIYYQGGADLFSLEEVSLLPEHCLASTCSTESLALARHWIYECDTKHTRCRSLVSSFIPTRLLDVGTNNSDIRLCLGTDIVLGSRYITLSHFWGQLLPLRLLKNNVNSMMKEVPFSKLTKTFQDAIFVTREIGERYLWIDSLCIIQDSGQDWQAESSLMTQVYSNSLFNISATFAEDEYDGLFSKRDASKVESVKIMSTQKGIPTPQIIINKNMYSAIDSGPLSKRAWVIQERLLSPGNLHFTSTQLFWECLQNNACETFPKTIPPGLRNSPFKSSMVRILELAVPLGNPKSPLPLYAWLAIVEKYTSCSLTYRKDKLVAIAGLARLISINFKAEYYAGLWRDGFPEQLLWRCHQTPTPSHLKSQLEYEYVAPSWSWASSNTACVFKGKFRSTDYVCLDIKNIHIELANDDDSFGQVKNGYLRVGGRLARANLLFPGKWKVGSMIISGLGKRERERRGKFENCEVFLDVWVEEDEFVEEIVWFLPVVEKACEFEYGEGIEEGEKEGIKYNRTMGLVLRQTGNEKEFERIGIFDLRDEGRERLLDGARWFDCVAEEFGFDCVDSLDGVSGKRKYLVTIR